MLARRKCAGFGIRRTFNSAQTNELLVHQGFRTGAKCSAAYMPRDATPIFFPEKENGRRPSKRKAFPIASEQLEELQCLPNRVPTKQCI
ncbi:MAG: hypothetical protein Q3X57_06610, partial [Oscillospiraceae bacterium]|nr:hypothetical protein [Oscillospiraceae bacterium]